MMPCRLNGKMDEATLEAIKAAPEHEQMEFLLTCAFETRRTVKNLPELMERAIKEHEQRFHSEERERKWWIAETVGDRLAAAIWITFGAILVTVVHYLIWGM